MKREKRLVPAAAAAEVQPHYDPERFAPEERRRSLEHLKAFVDEEEGVGVVEIILILVVLISLVLIFKNQLTSLVNSIFKKIVSQSNSV